MMSYDASELDPLLKKTKAASRSYAILTSGKKNEALEKIARQLEMARPEILKANRQDYEEALSRGLSPAMCDRLLLTESRFSGMVSGVREVAALPDPVGTAVSRWENPDGLVIEKVRVPIGLVGVVYESRPNVTVEVASLCLKSGNGVVLKGGSEAVRSNTILSQTFWEGLAEANINPDGIAFLPWTDRKVVQDLVSNTTLDVVIPRGGGPLLWKLWFPMPGFRSCVMIRESAMCSFLPALPLPWPGTLRSTPRSTGLPPAMRWKPSWFMNSFPTASSVPFSIS